MGDNTGVGITGFSSVDSLCNDLFQLGEEGKKALDFIGNNIDNLHDNIWDSDARNYSREEFETKRECFDIYYNDIHQTTETTKAGMETLGTSDEETQAEIKTIYNNSEKSA